MDTVWLVRGRAAGIPVPSWLGAFARSRPRQEKPHGKDKRPFPAWSTRLV